MDESLPRSVLAAHYPERELVAIEPVSDGNRRETVVAWFAETPPVVVQWTQAVDRLEVETALMDAIRARTAVPVPETLAVGTSEGVGYAVREHRAGASLHTVFTAVDAGTRARFVREFGRYLGELHAAFPVDGVGRVSVTDGARTEGAAHGNGAVALTAPASDSREWLSEYGERAVRRLPADFDPLRERLRTCLRSVTEYTVESARLFPWDLRPGNALVAGTDITAIVDWEGALAAHPGLAAAKARYLTAEWYDIDVPRLGRAFRDGYESVRAWPTVRPAHGLAAIAESAVDSAGAVTNPGYPPYDRERSVEFHRSALERALPD
jgi:hypothetical protein